MFKSVNVCYVSMLFVGTKDVVNGFKVVLAAILAQEVKMLVCVSVHNKLHNFAMFISNESLFSNYICYVSILVVGSNNVCIILKLF